MLGKYLFTVYTNIPSNSENAATRMKKVTVVTRCDAVIAQHMAGEAVKLHESLNLH
jgi:hypothetical protein